MTDLSDRMVTAHFSFTSCMIWNVARTAVWTPQIWFLWLCVRMLSFDLSLVIFLFLSIHEMMVIFHDHPDIKSRAAPTGQRRTIYSSYFLAVITSCHSSSPSSSGPISVPSFQSKTSLFSSLYQGGARNGHLQTRMNESGPAHFRAVYRSGLVVIVREWEKRNMRSRDENPVLWTSVNISWFLPVCSELRCRAERQVMVWDLSCMSFMVNIVFAFLSTSCEGSRGP